MTAPPLYSSELTVAAENYVRKLLTDGLPPIRYFHNINHTVQVVGKSAEIAALYDIPQGDGQVLVTAAWFHDSGYVHGGDNHERRSVNIAREFLSNLNVESDDLLKIERLILATRIPASPLTLAEKILCDADLQHLGSEDYAAWSILLKKELEAQNGNHISDEQWNYENIRFFTSHRFFTERAETLWEIQKQKNLLMLLAERKHHKE